MRAFFYRSGVRLAGTTLACDPSRTANEVVFLSHAAALPSASDRRGGWRAWQQVLLSPGTLALLGPVGVRLSAPPAPRALVGDYGRPFALGTLRLELFPSGFGPGAASLRCTVGDRRLVYTGPLRPGPPAPGAREAEVRPAEALCLDATFGDPRFVFPPRAEVLDHLARAVEEALARGQDAVILCAPATALELCHVLGARGLELRAHTGIVALAKRHRAAGLATPALSRFSGRLPRGAVLLWPPEHRDSPLLRALTSPWLAFASGLAVDPHAVTAVRGDAAFPLPARAGHDELCAYAQATGALEVATIGRHAEALARSLEERGHRAYALVPPHQIPLFAGPGTTG